MLREMAPRCLGALPDCSTPPNGSVKIPSQPDVHSWMVRAWYESRPGERRQLAWFPSAVCYFTAFYELGETAGYLIVHIRHQYSHKVVVYPCC